jgi:YD repeat-containing protein
MAPGQIATLRLGQITTRTDQRGTVRSFNYDKLGRSTDDRVTTNGTGTDVAVKRISSTYEVRGMIEKLTSYDNATPGSGTALNQVKLACNGFGQLTREDQAHGGTVTGGTPAWGMPMPPAAPPATRSAPPASPIPTAGRSILIMAQAMPPTTGSTASKPGAMHLPFL